MIFYLVFITLTFLSPIKCILLWSDTKTCNPRFHYWQPFYGTIPPKAYLAGQDVNGEKKYIARIVSPDKRSWSAPTTFAASKLYVFFSWEGKDSYKVEKCIEILCVDRPARGFGWRPATKFWLSEVKEACCFVEGGSGYLSGRKITSYIGRTLRRGVYYIGGVYDAEWRIFSTVHPFRYCDELGTAKGLSSEFEVLAYDCCSTAYCKTQNKAECCYDLT